MRQEKDDTELTISQLVSVLDPASVDPGGIVLGCLVHFTDGKGKVQWKVYPPDQRTKFIPRVFLLAQLAYRKLTGDYHPLVTELAHEKEPQLLVDTRDPDHSFLTGYLANVRSYRKNKKRYPNLAEDLWACIPSDQMFWAEGRRKVRWLRHSAALVPESFAFITMADFTTLTGLKIIPEDPQGTVVKVHRETIESNKALDARTLAELVRRFPRRATRRTYSWQELYLKTLLSQLDLPKTLIPLEAVEREQTEARLDPTLSELLESPRPLNLLENLQRRNAVLLTGSGGSGKTTALRVLAQELASQWLRHRPGTRPKKKPAHAPASFPVLAELDVAQTGTKAPLRKLVAQNVARVFDCCTKEELARCEPVAHLPGHASMSSPQMLIHLTDAVFTWLGSDEACSESTVFLFDRLDNVHFYPRETLAAQLRDWASSPVVHCRLVLATRAWGWNPAPQALYLELQPLRPQVMQGFLQKRLGSRRGSVAWAQMTRTVKTLEFFRTPFFLDRIVGVWEKAEEFGPLGSCTSAIEAIIEEALKLKIAEHAVSDDVDSRTRNRVLGILGYGQLEALTFEQPETRSGGSQQQQEEAIWARLDELHCPVAKVLEQAETCGILLRSGLRGAADVPTFDHDYFRDYCAAVYLATLAPVSMLATLRRCLEFRDWDQAVLMLAELLPDADLISRVVSLILCADTVFACEVMAHARAFGHDIAVRVLDSLLSDHASLGWSYARRRKATPYAPLARFLSRLSRETLFEIYNLERASAYVWAAVPLALLFQGSDPLIELAASERLRRLSAETFEELLHVFLVWGTPQALELALSLVRRVLAMPENARWPYVLIFPLYFSRWPWSGSLHALIEALRNTPDEEMHRVIACSFRGATCEPANAVSELGPLLTHPTRLVVREALKAIGRLGGREAGPFLGRYVQKLCAAGARADSGLLLSAFHGLALAAPMKAGHLAGVVARRPGGFTDSEWRLLIVLASRLQAAESFEMLLSLLVTKGRLWVYGALARLKDVPGATEAMKRAMLRSRRSGVRDRIAVVRGLMGDGSVGDQLVRMIEESAQGGGIGVKSSVEFQAIAANGIRAVSQLKREEIAPALRSLVGNRETAPIVRDECVRGLGVLGGRSNFNFLVELTLARPLGPAGQEALLSCASLVGLEDCGVMLTRLKEAWDEAQAEGNRCAAKALREAAAEIVVQRGRRFVSALEGWPLAVRCVTAE